MQQAQQQAATQQVTQKSPSQVQPGQSSVIYNSSISSPPPPPPQPQQQQPPQSFSTAVTQPSFSAVSQSYGSVTPSQAFTAMVSSQTFQQSPSSSYQSPSSISGSASYSRAACKSLIFDFSWLYYICSFINVHFVFQLSTRRRITATLSITTVRWSDYRQTEPYLRGASLKDRRHRGRKPQRK